MRRVILKKIVDDPYGQNVSLEKTFEGWEEHLPVVGQPYSLLLDSGRVLKTSNVVKVLEGYLVTENSLYKFDVIEEKPFDLGTGLKETREMVFPKGFPEGEQKERLSSLSARELEVFQLLAEGLSVKAAGDLLCISSKTVETHKRRVMEKLGIHSMSQWIKEAIRAGILKVEP